MPEFIRIRGARTHNLKNIDLDIPRDKLVVITGLSGSGKSSVAFDTLYAEGQRRYAESLSSYARHFMDVMDKPDVDAIEGLSPSIAIEQHSSAAGARSTVGTMTEINDYLRILFARAGVPYCPDHDVPLVKSGIHDMVDAVLAEPEGSRIAILAPMRFEGDEKYCTLGEQIKLWQAKGYMRVRVDGEIYSFDEVPARLLETEVDAIDIEIVIDRLKAGDSQRTRLAESFEAAGKLTEGRTAHLNMQTGVVRSFSKKFCCPVCERTMPEMTPAMFSFNNALGACPKCQGAGLLEDFDPKLIVRDESLSLTQGAVCGCTPNNADNWSAMKVASNLLKFSLDVAYSELPESVKAYILYGKVPQGQAIATPFEGIVNQLTRQWQKARSEAVKVGMRVLRRTMTCPECYGSRYRREVQSVYVGEADNRINLLEIQHASLATLQKRLSELTFSELNRPVGQPLLEEVLKRIGFLCDVGLSYLTLERSSATLSGGELQRIRLAGQIGAGLTGVTYVLDEPTIGLHQRDTAKVVDMLKRLTQMGNSVIVVEHDPDVITAADWIVDMGPGAGVNGGEVVASGTPEEIAANPASRTGRYLAQGQQWKSRDTADEIFTKDSPALVIRGARGHNLKNLTCRFPVGALTVVTGVSGSGKSTLINDTLAAHLKKRFHRAKTQSLDFETLEGVDYFDKVIEVDQSPIGKTPRSNPATYTGLMTAIREVFAQTPGAQERGYGPGRFTFNTEGGCCEACQGEGQIKIEMGFLPPVYVMCPTCHGRRYNRETLEVKYRGKSVADVLDMTVDEAAEFFSAFPAIVRKLKTLSDVGLGYIGLGQSAVTFSGGEAQRIKLAEELSRKDTGRTLYILDEPTTGLHFDDVAALLKVLRRLTDLGNTVIVIEHNLDMIAAADWIVDIGPEGGDAGGELVFEGSPDELRKSEISLTGKFLREAIENKKKPTAKKTAVKKMATRKKKTE
ncbi:MAG: excinuclease ABC subunit UvrA [Sutterellaceae bacterium]|nr:excinuclease ABC subunit UvrA [Sutterellaceae bacterium]